MRKVSAIVSKFFDFYSIYELYLRCGGFRNEGYASYDTFVNEKVFESITEAYNSIVDSYYEEVYDALLISIRSEVRHFPRKCQAYWYNNDSEFFRRLAKKTKTTVAKLREAKKAVSKDRKAVAQYAYLVRAMFANSKWECSYGGSSWAKAVDLVIAAQKLRTRHERVGWIDKVLDLKHNTGQLLNKTVFRKLGDYVSHPKTGNPTVPLDFRKNAKSVLSFIPFNSERVRNLVTARKRLLEV